MENRNVDGTKIFGSDKKCCPECLTSTKNGKTHFYHYGSAMSIIGYGHKLTLGFETCRPREGRSKDEGEMVRLLLKGLYLLKYTTDLVFNSSWNKDK